VIAAVAELAAAGLVTADLDARLAYRVGYIERHVPRDRSRMIAWQRSAQIAAGTGVAGDALAALATALERRPAPAPAPSVEATPAPATARPSRRAFVPPTQDEVAARMAELGMPPNYAAAESAKFFSYYSSNGWKVGGRAPMRDWRAACVGWCARWAEQNPGKLQRFGIAPEPEGAWRSDAEVEAETIAEIATMRAAREQDRRRRGLDTR